MKNKTFYRAQLSNQLHALPTSTFAFSLPRIACPNQNGNLDDWTVVVEDFDYTYYYIDGYNNNAGTVSSLIVYNDGSQSPGSTLQKVQNGLPVVTYDGAGNVWVGWTFDNLTGYYNYMLSGYTNVTEDALYPIVLKCDNQAIPVTNTDYWQVPTVLTATNNDDVNILSLSGRAASDNLYQTYFVGTINNSAVNDIYTKKATPSTTTQLKLMNIIPVKNTSAVGNDFLLTGSNNFDLKYCLKLYDLTGKIVLEKTGTADEINGTLLKNEIIPNSIYLAHIISIDGDFSLTRKIIVEN